MDPGEVADATAKVVGALAGTGSVGWTLKQLIGPSVQKAGDVFGDFTDFKLRNVLRMADNATSKGGPALEAGHEVSPRVFKRIIEDGSWAEGPVMAEYFGGIWAASLSPNGDDDRGLAWADLVSRLPASDLLLHYLIYDSFRQIFAGRDVDLGNNVELARCSFYVPMARSSGDLPAKTDGEETGVTWDPRGAEAPLVTFDVTAAMISLDRQGLIGPGFSSGSGEHLSGAHEIDAPVRGVAVAPSLAGIELFLWAHGISQPFPAILDTGLRFETVEDLPRVEGARELAAMVTERRERQLAELRGSGALNHMSDDQIKQLRPLAGLPPTRPTDPADS